MRARIQKWGNSLALRIPKAFASEIHLVNESEVDLSLRDGKLVVVPLAKPEPTLEELLKGVTKDNLHGEFDTGPRQGKEVW
jgi:antitoxin MazE